jgi:hypothetical protein
MWPAYTLYVPSAEICWHVPSVPMYTSAGTLWAWILTEWVDRPQFMILWIKMKISYTATWSFHHQSDWTPHAVFDQLYGNWFYRVGVEYVWHSKKFWDHRSIQKHILIHSLLDVLVFPNLVWSILGASYDQSQHCFSFVALSHNHHLSRIIQQSLGLSCDIMNLDNVKLLYEWQSNQPQ